MPGANGVPIRSSDGSLVSKWISVQVLMDDLGLLTHVLKSAYGYEADYPAMSEVSPLYP